MMGSECLLFDPPYPFKKCVFFIQLVSNFRILYVVWKQVIRAYSAKTGDFVKELEPADHKIISITLSPENPDTIIGCTDNAELVHWNSQNGLITFKTVKNYFTLHYN